jgi:hypothetical protein
MNHDPKLHSALLNLWNHAVQSVLQALGLLRHDPKPKPLPRVRWVVSGISSLLPLHAAGSHIPGSTDNTISHVVSSYSPSLMALDSLCRKPQFAIHDEKANVVVVSMPTSPRHTPLAVAQEVEAIVTHTMSWASTVCLERPTKKRVLYALTSCTVAHFACHGIVDENNPLQSGLIIGREAEEKLSVADLESVTCEHSRIA